MSLFNEHEKGKDRPGCCIYRRLLDIELRLIGLVEVLTAIRVCIELLYPKRSQLYVTACSVLRVFTASCI